MSKYEVTTAKDIKAGTRVYVGERFGTVDSITAPVDGRLVAEIGDRTVYWRTDTKVTVVK